MRRSDGFRALAAERGFTTVELMLAVFVTAVGIVALIGTLDMSRRVTNLSEMKEAASHVAEQRIEELRALHYREVALAGVPESSTDPDSPAYYVAADGASYRWNQDADAPSPHTEPLVVCAVAGGSCPVVGKIGAAPLEWSDGRLKGKVYRYVTDAGGGACPDGSPCRKRLTVAVTVENPGGPKKPILMSVILANPAPVTGSNNPLKSPDTKCIVDGQLVPCANSIDGKVHAYYLYDTPATFSARQEISGSHPTHPTVAPTGSCSGSGGEDGDGADGDGDGGCPVPDLMGPDPPPSSATPPPLYNYSNEISGGSWPGGAVLRRDTTCDGAPTSTDNTKGHLWVTAPLSAPMTVTGQAAVNLSTATFSGVAAQVTLCVRFYNVPGSIANLVDAPPTAIGSASHGESSWPRTATMLGFSLDFRGSAGSYTIPAGNRLGVRLWVAASAGADIAAIYDHVLHQSFVQVNEAE